MASKRELGSGEVTIYDPGLQLGRMSAAGDGGDNFDLALSPDFGRRPFALGFPLSGSTNLGSLGMAGNITGTGTAVNVTTTNYALYLPRIDYVSPAAAPNHQAGWRQATGVRGLIGVPPNPNGGFAAYLRFAAIDNPNNLNGWRFLAGLTNGAAIGDVDPSTQQSSFAFMLRAADTTWKLICTSNAGAVIQLIDTGIPRPALLGLAGDNDVWEARFICAPPIVGVAPVIKCRLMRLNPDRPIVWDGEVTVFNPDASFYPGLAQIWMGANTGAGGGACRVGVYALYTQPVIRKIAGY